MHALTENTLKLANGTQFLYTDSDAPTDSADYRTLVGFHGTGFNSATFDRLHQHAHNYNLRTIFVNRRDYRGSTPYSDEEMEDLNTGKEGAYEGVGLEVAQILEQLVDVGAQRMLVMAWSSGSTLLVSFLGNPDAIPSALNAKLQPRIEGFVIYDAVYQMVGAPPAPEVTMSFLTPEVIAGGPQSMSDAFEWWIAGHYVHPDLASGLPSCLFSGNATRSTIDALSPEERARWCESAPGIRSWILPQNIAQVSATWMAQSNRAFFDTEAANKFFPATRVVYIAGDETVALCMWGYVGLRRRVEAEGAKRDIKFVLAPKQNHFMHYEAPEVFLKVILESFA
ncbi:AB hydrolase-1 domain-containing protein [Mycena kentingensis (nom. inval.)]|nr:AB hydrolase-1 domain-containing protein [Mycena kentingensis (nom. inval.)]